MPKDNKGTFVNQFFYTQRQEKHLWHLCVNQFLYSKTKAVQLRTLVNNWKPESLGACWAQGNDWFTGCVSKTYYFLCCFRFLDVLYLIFLSVPGILTDFHRKLSFLWILLVSALPLGTGALAILGFSFPWSCTCRFEKNIVVKTHQSRLFATEILRCYYYFLSFRIFLGRLCMSCRWQSESLIILLHI